MKTLDNKTQTKTDTLKRLSDRVASHGNRLPPLRQTQLAQSLRSELNPPGDIKGDLQAPEEFNLVSAANFNIHSWSPKEVRKALVALAKRIYSNREVETNFEADFPEMHGQALIEFLATRKHRRGVRILEIGSCRGASTGFFAEYARLMDGMVCCVDRWRNSEDDAATATTLENYTDFHENIRTLGLEDVVHPIHTDPLKAASFIQDHSFDIIFIDADNRYSMSRKDIEVYWSKLKPNGTFCGHDCDVRYDKLTPEEQAFVDRNGEQNTAKMSIKRNPSWSSFRVNSGVIEAVPAPLQPPKLQPLTHVHCGVVKAVQDCFGERYAILPDSSIWIAKGSPNWNNFEWENSG